MPGNLLIMPKKVYIKSWGCQMNVRDSEVIYGLLAKQGYELVDDSAKADIILFNTCSVRQHAEDKVWSEIGRIAKQGEKEKGDSPQKAGTVPFFLLLLALSAVWRRIIKRRFLSGRRRWILW